MGRILGIAHFAFHEGRAEKFLQLSVECLRLTRERDRGTLRYEVYVNEERTRAVVVEEYEDEAALLEHGEHIGASLTEAILATGEVHGEIVGELSPEMCRRLRGGPVTAFLPAHTLPKSQSDEVQPEAH
ncbi:antibiotic biosynthesis monooxygenase [uncultured Brevibacterium sp.]|uniref:putative quinol monooxygenase n=1 Tax=uncultured Brevibacterium sp. TaxID=189678 RepID=UPI0025D13B3A|nr:antibiotic biosynthesis monooxygenase [uncultured Brevibacterium sp.]